MGPTHPTQTLNENQYQRIYFIDIIIIIIIIASLDLYYKKQLGVAVVAISVCDFSSKNDCI